MTVTLYQGDCLDILPTLADNSIDSIVTDPPAGIGFMDKDWDKDKGGRNTWIAWMTKVAAECLRVLKPGGHAFVWALPRTSHWTATAWEDARFEVREKTYHLFGSGFPKSLAIDKAIDKAAGAEREVSSIVSRTGKAVGTYGAFAGPSPISIPATDLARQWDGWGTALKPAAEEWIMLRKPLDEKTIAANVTEWGTGAINIDGCRVPAGGETSSRAGGRRPATHEGYQRPNKTMFQDKSDWRLSEQGRWPANVILDEEAADELGDKSRFFYVAKASKRDREEGLEEIEAVHRANGNKWTDIDYRVISGERPPSAESGPRRNHHPTVKSTPLMRYLCRMITPPDGIVLDPFAGSGSTGKGAVLEGFSFVGIELDEGYYNIARRRIEDAQAQLQLGVTE